MRMVAPRTGAPEVTIAEDQPDYRTLVAAKYDDGVLLPSSEGPAARLRAFVLLFVGAVASAWFLAWQTSRDLPAVERRAVPDTATYADDMDESGEARAAQEDARRRRAVWLATPEGKAATEAEADWRRRFVEDSIARYGR